jgi:purine-binding chemotaxis protein CheW
MATNRARPEADDIDWTLARERLARALRATEESDAPTPEQSREILRERARKLAEPIEHDNADADEIAVVVFSLGQERYAVEARFVHEIVRGVDITPLPETPAFVAGAAKLRGEIHSIFDIHSLLGLPSMRSTSSAPIVALGNRRIEFGILADEVHEIVQLASADILPPPLLKDEEGSRRVRGVTKDALVVLDGAALLEDERLYVGNTGGD